MFVLLWQTAFFFSLWSGSFVTDGAVLNILAPSAPSAIGQLQYGTNSTLSAAVPMDFKIFIQEQRGPKLPGKLCLQTAVQVIGKHLALEDFIGRIPTQGWSQSNLVISVSTQGVTGNSIQRRYVIWGIFQALAQMIRENDFRSAIFRLEWRGAPVGSVAFYPGNDIAEIDLPNKSKFLTKLVLPTLSNDTGGNDSALLVPGALREPVLQVTLVQTYPALSLNLYGIFMNLIGLLMVSAEQGEDKILDYVYLMKLGDYGVQVLVAGGNDPLRPPPTRPPYLKYRWIIKAVAMTPSLMASRGHSDAFRIQMLLDQVQIGTITVEGLP